MFWILSLVKYIFFYITYNPTPCPSGNIFFLGIKTSVRVEEQLMKASVRVKGQLMKASVRVEGQLMKASDRVEG